MSKKTVTVIVVLAVALGGVLVWGFITNGTLNTTREELASVKEELSATKLELADTRDELASTEDELRDTEDELLDTQEELSDTQDELKSTESQLASTTATLSSTRSELASTKSELNSVSQELENTDQQLTIARETLEGLGITLSSSVECYDAELVDNPDSSKSTWSELKLFLMQDITNTRQYVLGEYDCSEFSRDVHNNAEAAGIRAAVVHVAWTNSNTAHALNAFLTTDYGLVYVDCTGADTVARIKVNRPYRAVQINAVSIGNIREDWYWNGLYAYYYIPTSTGGQAITDEIIIYW